jgi:hypothetical protein
MRYGGSGCYLLLGFPFLLAGVGIMLVPIFGEPGLSAGLPKALLVTVPFGLVFCIIGALLLLLRCEFVIDKQRGDVSVCWRLLVPVHTQRASLDDFDRVGLRRTEVESGGHTTVTYQARLEGSGGPLALMQDSKYQPVRFAAERVARFLHFDLHDSARGPTTVRFAAELDQPLGDRLRQSGVALNLPPLPDESELTFFVRDGKFHVSMPPRKLGLHGIWALIVFLALWVAPGTVLLSTWAARGSGTGLAAVLPPIMWCFLVLFPLLCTLWELYKHFSTTRTLTVSSDRLEFKEAYFPRGHRVHTIPADELEELQPDDECLTALSDTESIDFGFGLSDREREWLEQVVKAILAGGREG